MEVTASADRFVEACEEIRRRGGTVGLVPTMGALHRGHVSLLERALADRSFVAMSVFVNPLQFGPGEDLSSYPRDLDGDLSRAEAAGCHLAFTPEEKEMYPNGPPEITVDPGPLGGRLEGASRPGHFRGVLTVVAKLFHLAGPGRAYFGEKDAQQLELVRRMVADLDLPVDVIGCPTVREPDGLAMSSRNAFLSPQERAAAPCLVRALAIAARLVDRDERNADAIRAEMARRIGAEPLAKLDYVAVVDQGTWEDVTSVIRPARALVAARLGLTRLIDNLVLPGPGSARPRAGQDPAQ